MQRKWIWIASIFLLLVLLWGGSQVLTAHLNESLRQTQEQLKTIARLKVEQITAWRKERLGDGEVLRNNVLLTPLLIRWLNISQDTETPQLLQNYLGELQRQYGYQDHWLVDATGHVRLHNGVVEHQVLSSDLQTAVEEAYRSHRATLSEIYVGSQLPYPHMALVVPLFQGESPAGALLLAIDVRQTLYPLIQTWPVPSESAESLMVRRDGSDVLFLNELRHISDYALKQRFPLTQIQLPSVQAVLGKTGLIEGRDYRGIPVLAAALPIPQSTWFLVAKVDTKEIYAEPRREALFLGGWLLSVLALLLGLPAFFWQRHRLKLEEQLNRAEAARLESLQEFQNLFEQSSDGILLLTRDHRFLDANPAALRLLGYGLEELKTLGLAQVLAPHERARLDRDVPKMMAGTPHRGEWMCQRRDGSTFIAESTAKALDQSRYFSYFRDITQQKSAEESLQASELKFSLAFQSSPYAIVITRQSDGKILEVNPAFEALSGYPRQDAVGKTTLELGMWVDVQERERFLTDLRQKGRIDQREYLFCRRDETQFTGLISALPFALQGEPVLLGSILDISERKAAERALRAQAELREQLSQFAETVPGMVYTYRQRPDGSGFCPYISPRVEEVFGVSQRAAQQNAQCLYAPIHADDLDRVLDTMKQSAQTLTPWQAEFRIHHPKRGVIWLHTLSTPKPDPEGGLLWFGFTIDITQRKHTERTLRLSQFSLENAGDAVYWIRPDGTFFYANAAASKMLGYSSHQLVRMGVVDLNADFGEARWREHFAQLKTEGSVLLESTHRASNGRLIPVEVSANYITFEGTEYNCAIVRDITARRALEQEQRLTRLTVHQSADSIYWLREDGSIYFVNDTACRSLDYGRDTLLSMTVFDIDPIYSRDAWVQNWHAVNRSETVMLETLHRRRDGSQFPVEVTGNYLELDGQRLKCAIVRDISERKAAQAELQQRTHLLESAQEAAHLGYYLTDLNTRHWTSSPMLDAIMGIDAAYEHTVDGWSQLVHPEDRQQARTEFEHAVQQQVPLHHQYRLVRPRDGRIIWVDAWGMFEHDQGHPVRLIGTVMDITERKTAELELEQYRLHLEVLVEQRTQALTASEERFRLAMQATNDGLWDYNAVSHNVYFNPTYATMLGYAPRELGDDIETVFNQLLHPDDREPILKHIFEEFVGSGHHETEFRLRCKDGRYRWILGRGQVVERDASGVPLRMIGTHVDITDRKRAELALVESEHRFKDMADSAPVLIWIAGLDKLCTYFNKTWLEFTGRTLEQEVGNGWAEGVHPDDIDQCLTIYMTAFDARQAFTMDYRLRRHDGEYRWIQDNGMPRFDGQGQFLGYIGSCVDVTDRRLVEQQIRNLNVSLEQKVKERTAQLQAASAAKTQFLAHMSHELRTPMNAVLGLAQLLEKEPLEPGELAMVRHIRESGDSLLHIINDILDFSKIEAGQLRLDPQPFTVPELLTRVDHLLRNTAESKGLALDVQQNPTEPGLLLGDPLRLEQILINLTGNAIKFTAEGRITLSVRSVTSEEAPIRVRFEVQDTGIGIAPDVIGQLFKPFSQADASITRHFGGTGLGLAISRRLVDLMGGEMGVTSQVGQGSTFWFEVPFQAATGQETRDESIEVPEEAQPVGPQLTGLRVLAVDDSRLNLMVVERALTREGAKVTLAADGQQALQILKAQPHAFDVVLMDIQMPVMDGLTATREIRQDAVLSPLPVIALTAGVLPEERQAALDAGVNGFLAKPIDLEQLMSGLAKFLPVH